MGRQKKCFNQDSLKIACKTLDIYELQWNAKNKCDFNSLNRMIVIESIRFSKGGAPVKSKDLHEIYLIQQGVPLAKSNGFYEIHSI
jgi:hypothetical protein